MESDKIRSPCMCGVMAFADETTKVDLLYVDHH